MVELVSIVLGYLLATKDTNNSNTSEPPVWFMILMAPIFFLGFLFMVMISYFCARLSFEILKMMLVTVFPGLCPMISVFDISLLYINF